jgi:hypothetical protein
VHHAQAMDPSYRLVVTVNGTSLDGLARVCVMPGPLVELEIAEPSTAANQFVVTTSGEAELAALRLQLITELGNKLLRCEDPLLEQAGGGKLRIRSVVPLETRADLALAYTPGVGRLATMIAENPSTAKRSNWPGESGCGQQCAGISRRLPGSPRLRRAARHHIDEARTRACSGRPR